jgi:hypothetical protein
MEPENTPETNIRPCMISCKAELHDAILAIKINYGYKSMNQALEHIYNQWYQEHKEELNEQRNPHNTTTDEPTSTNEPSPS